MSTLFTVVYVWTMAFLCLQTARHGPHTVVSASSASIVSREGIGGEEGSRGGDWSISQFLDRLRSHGDEDVIATFPGSGQTPDVSKIIPKASVLRKRLFNPTGEMVPSSYELHRFTNPDLLESWDLAGDQPLSDNGQEDPNGLSSQKEADGPLKIDQDSVIISPSGIMMEFHLSGGIEEQTMTNATLEIMNAMSADWIRLPVICRAAVLAPDALISVGILSAAHPFSDEVRSQPNIYTADVTGCVEYAVKRGISDVIIALVVPCRDSPNLCQLISTRPVLVLH